jgi:hypothetical protein
VGLNFVDMLDVFWMITNDFFKLNIDLRAKFSQLKLDRKSKKILSL